jgi:dihydrodipicolinate synthase/N-acetylneuraminate lyase
MTISLSRRKFLALSGAAAGTSAATRAAFSLTQQDFHADSQFYWPPDRALPVFPEAFHLDAADLTALDGDQQGLLVSLEGIVNRKRPRLYFYWGTDPSNLEWLKSIEVPYTITTDPWSLLAHYRQEISGAIVYDPNVPDTINLATTLAGVHGAVIATADLATQYHLPIVEDLRGRFANKLAVYQYALSNVWPHLTKRLVTAIGPSSTQATAGVQWTILLEVTQPVTDASNKATYTVDLSSFLGKGSVYVRYQDAYSNTGWGPSVSQVTVTANGSTIASFQPGTSAELPFLFDADSSQIASGGWRFADGTNYFIYKFTPPAGTTSLTLSTLMWNQYLITATNTAPSYQVANPLFRDYIVATSAPVFWLDPDVTEEAALFAQILQTVDPDTPYLGWFPNGDEMTGVTLCAQHATVVVAADDFYNASVLSGVRAPVKSFQPRVPVPQLANKIYLSLTLVEGDNIQYDQHRMRQMWDDPTRGQVPLGWSVSVLLYDIAPAMLNYFQKTQTINDLLVAGPSGAGYTYPVMWPAAALPKYMQRSGAYMERTGMRTLFAYNRDNSTDVPLSNELVAQYKAGIPGLEGIVYNYESASQISLIDGLPVAILLGVNDAPSGITELATIAASWNGTAPLFVAAGLESWNMMPSDAKTLVDSLDSQFEVVRPDVFFKLFLRAQKKQ